MSDPLKNRGSVRVEGDRYRLSGDFHFIYPNEPIRNEEGQLIGVTNPRDITHIHSYGGEAPFFQALTDGKLLATRCCSERCRARDTVFLPFRVHCPDCLEKNEIIEVTDIARETARIHTFMITERTGAFNTLPHPVKFIDVQIDGISTILMSNMILGTPEIEQRVVPAFKVNDPTFTILDLGWVPVGTDSTELPEGFRL